jgi:glycosyltransferase involved in cell wall biosynthesis
LLRIDPYRVQKADLIVGIPSYNEADNIAFVVNQCNLGLKKYFPHLKSVIINADNHSPDDTRHAFLNSMNTIPKLYLSTEPGVRGKGNNFYNLFQEAQRLAAKAVIVVDADITSITPEWITNLASPILKKNFDYVSPLYSRNEYDGTITNNICYPIIYGLLNADIRQPIGGDFALSGKLVDHYLRKKWQETTFQYGIDIFMTMKAILGNFPACQVGLGTKIHKPSAPKLGDMFVQVVGTLFDILIESKRRWLPNDQLQKIPYFGAKSNLEPQSLSIDYKSIKHTAIKEFNQYHQILRALLSPTVYHRLEQMYRRRRITIGMDLWTRIVYELLFKYDKSNRTAPVIEALKPLYFGRVITFIRQTLDKDHHASEQAIRRQAHHFFRNKKYLMRMYGVN